MQVRAAYADGRIPSGVADEEDYREILAAALARPNDEQRLANEHIEDVLAELERWPLYEPGADADSDKGGDFPEWTPLRGLPVRNPFAGIGRNDPCPCGSGKKFKKCCLR